MSSIDKLIAEHGPDGVQYVEISRLFDLRNGYTPSKSNASFWTEGTVPWFRMEDIRANGGILDRSLQQIPEIAVKGGKLFPANSLLVATSATIGEHALVTVPHLSNQRFTSLSIKAEYSEQVDMKFVYYYGFVLDEWCRNNITTSSFASVDMAGFKRFRIPVPPLEVQREIVRVLDKFTKLEAALEAELEARRRQYEHYRDAAFEGSFLRNDWKYLSEVGLFERGSALQKKDLVDVGVPCIHYGQVYTFYGVSAKETKSYVTTDFARGKRYLNPGDVFVATTSENEEDLGKAVAWLGSEPAIASSDAYIFRTELDARYVSYFFASTHFHEQKKRFITGTKVKRLSAGAMEKIQIPVPDRAEQEKIADALDCFDALVNDLNIGLPAELAARRKQYEYYRDRLLSFKEATA